MDQHASFFQPSTCIGAFPLLSGAFGENHLRPNGPVRAVIEKYLNIYRECRLTERPWRSFLRIVKAAVTSSTRRWSGFARRMTLRSRTLTQLSLSSERLIWISWSTDADPEAENLASSWVRGRRGSGKTFLAEIALAHQACRNLGWQSRALPPRSRTDACGA